MTAACRVATLGKPNPLLQRTSPAYVYLFVSSSCLEQQPNDPLGCSKHPASNSARNPEQPPGLCQEHNFEA